MKKIITILNNSNNKFLMFLRSVARMVLEIDETSITSSNLAQGMMLACFMLDCPLLVPKFL